MSGYTVDGGIYDYVNNMRTARFWCYVNTFMQWNIIQ
jgi:hypothetical protein